MLEETGLRVSGASLVGKHVVERTSTGARLTLHVFGARWLSGEPVAGDDAAEARFFSFDSVAGLETTPAAADWLQRARQALDI